VDGVRALSQDELAEATGTPGITRHVAFEADDHWFGHAEAAPATMSGWHHHGDNVTLGYVLSGEVTFEYGPGGSERATVGPGQYFRVPAGAVHREGNASDEPAEVVIVRVGQGPPVFPADGPEPA
jgi:uncharacterized RmlC-like cupin family protein